jgi:protein-S-isoprenylcysteine O-methyltransferase Ste14
MNQNAADRPGVIVAPPLLYLAAVAGGLALQLLFPVHVLPAAPARGLGGLLALAAVGVSRWARREMNGAGTNVSPYHPATAIVQTGPFHFSRNPLYVSLTAFYVGIALLVNTLWPLILLPPVLVVMHIGVVSREERYLEAKFGEEYRAYKARVRRWV